MNPMVGDFMPAEPERETEVPASDLDDVSPTSFSLLGSL
jgi:hypothetical protein